MGNITIEVLAEQIGNLSEKIGTGFKGVHKRQDDTNNKIVTNANNIVELQKEDIKIKGKVKTAKITWVVVTLLVSVILGLLGKYVY